MEGGPEEHGILEGRAHFAYAPFFSQLCFIYILFSVCRWSVALGRWYFRRETQLARSLEITETGNGKKLVGTQDR